MANKLVIIWLWSFVTVSAATCLKYTYKLGNNLEQKISYGFNYIWKWEKKKEGRKKSVLKIFKIEVLLILEKEMATHSSILTWEIPWTEEPDILQFLRLQRVGYNWVAKPQPPPWLIYTKYFILAGSRVTLLLLMLTDEHKI